MSNIRTCKEKKTLNYAALFTAEDIFHQQLLSLCPIIELDTSRELPTGREILNKIQAP